MKNTIFLEDLQRMPMGEVAALDPVTLAKLQEQAVSAMKRSMSAGSRKWTPVQASTSWLSGKDFGLERKQNDESR